MKILQVTITTNNIASIFIIFHNHHTLIKQCQLIKIVYTEVSISSKLDTIQIAQYQGEKKLKDKFQPHRLNYIDTILFYYRRVPAQYFYLDVILQYRAKQIPTLQEQEQFVIQSSYVFFVMFPLFVRWIEDRSRYYKIKFIYTSVFKFCYDDIYYDLCLFSMEKME